MSGTLRMARRINRLQYNHIVVLGVRDVEFPRRTGRHTYRQTESRRRELSHSDGTVTIETEWAPLAKLSPGPDESTACTEFLDAVAPPIGHVGHAGTRNGYTHGSLAHVEPARRRADGAERANESP